MDTKIPCTDILVATAAKSTGLRSNCLQNILIGKSQSNSFLIAVAFALFFSVFLASCKLDDDNHHEDPVNGSLQVDLTNAFASIGVDNAWAKDNTDTFTLYAYSTDKVVSASVDSTSNTITLDMTAGTYNVVLLAGDRILTGDTFLLAAGLEKGVDVIIDSVSRISIELKPVNITVDVPTEVDTGASFKVSANGAFPIASLKFAQAPTARLGAGKDIAMQLSYNGLNWSTTVQLTAPSEEKNESLTFTGSLLVLDDDLISNKSLDQGGFSWRLFAGQTDPYSTGVLSRNIFIDDPKFHLVCTTGCYFSSISQAIKFATGGDTIKLAAGTYAEKLVFEKRVSIVGSGIDITIIDASSFAEDAIKIQTVGSGSTIRDLTLVGTSGGYGMHISHVDNITLENIKVQNSMRTGVDLNTVETETLNNIEVTGTASGFGLMILNSQNVTVTNIKTNANAWGGVSIQSRGSSSNNVRLLGTFYAGEDNPLLVEQDPDKDTNYYLISNLQLPDKFEWLAYGFRDGSDYKQWFYQETEADADQFANTLAASSKFSYSNTNAYSIPAGKINHYVGQSIKEAIEAAADDDVVNLPAGTYNENIVVNKGLSLIGSGSEVNITPEDDFPVIRVSASGSSSVNPLLLMNLTIQTDNILPATGQGKMTGIMISGGAKLSNIKLDNISVSGNDQPYPGLESGIYLAPDTSLSGLVITNSLFRNLSYGFISGAITADNPGYLDKLNISHTTFKNNSSKGFYTERLSHSVFNHVSAIDNGDTNLSASWADAWNAGIDINLKYGTYQDIEFNNLIVTGNGIGSSNGAGLTVKARGTGNDPGYSANPATLSGITISGGEFSKNETGIRFGEVAKDNTSPIDISVSGATVTENRQIGLVNALATGVSVDAADNTWNSSPPNKADDDEHNEGDDYSGDVRL
ncbi:MAG: hypothetical protein ACN4GM_09715 [Gammaproteobacteria bacterium]